MTKQVDKVNKNDKIKLNKEYFRCPICNKILFEKLENARVENILIKCKCGREINPSI